MAYCDALLQYRNGFWNVRHVVTLTLNGFMGHYWLQSP
uniref:Uncharacterized protein n=1 Tax=Arundo donax TaxID=35708 RepID=A0A0A9BLQ7_ARUDO